MPENEVSQSAPHDSYAASTACWRCGLEVAVDASVCPHCAARQSTSLPGSAAEPHAPGAFQNVNLLFCTYTLLLVMGIVHALVLGLLFDGDGGFDAKQRRQVFTQILVVEGIDTLIIAVALIKSWGRFTRTLPRERVRVTAWLVSLPILAGLIAVNLAYHWLIRQWIQAP